MGSRNGSRADAERALALMASGVIRPRIADRIGLDGINNALKAMRAGASMAASSSSSRNEQRSAWKWRFRPTRTSLKVRSGTPTEAVLWWVDIFRGEVHRFDPASGRGRDVPARCTGRFAGAARRRRAARGAARRYLCLAPGRFAGGARQARAGALPTIASTTDAPTGRGGFGWAACTCRRPSRPAPSTGSIRMDNARAWPTASMPPTERRSRPMAAPATTPTAGNGLSGVSIAILKPGALANRRVFIELEPRSGAPDGAIVDADGFYWLTHAGGWRIVRYDPLGRVDRIVQLPVEIPTSAAFGGGDGRTLFITTARYGLDERALAMQPLAGSILAIDVGVAGMPDTKFAG